MGGVSPVLYRLLYRHDLPKYPRFVQISTRAYIFTISWGKVKNLSLLNQRQESVQLLGVSSSTPFRSGSVPNNCMPLYPSFPMHEQLPLADGVQQNVPYCRKIFSQKSNFIAVEHNIMKNYIYKLHNFKRRHWELSLSKVWNENERLA
jgi:hypothetical protein